MNPKDTAVPAFVLTACVLMCACTAADKFTIRDISDSPASSPEPQQLILKEPCKYVAGADISGTLSPGPLQPVAIAIPAPSNSSTKEAIYLIQIGDLPVQDENGGYDIASFIGVRKDGTLVPNLLLHSDKRGASPFANESVKIRFTPEDCHYSTEKS
jgi:hypothetical protein